MKNSFTSARLITSILIMLALGFSTLGVVPANAAAFTPGNLTLLVAAASANNTTGSIVEINTTSAGQSAIQTITLPDTSSADSYRMSGSATSTGYVSLSNDRTLLTFTGANSTNTSSNVNTLNPRGVYTVNYDGIVAKQTTYTGISGQQTRSATSLDNSTWYIGDQSGFYSNGTAAADPAGNIRGVKSFGGTVYAFTASASLPPVGSISAATGGTYTGLPGLPNGSSAMQDFYMVQSGDNGSTYDILYVLSATSNTAGIIAKYSLVSGLWTSNGTYATTFGGFGLAAADSGNGAALFISTGQGALTANSVIQVVDAAGYNTTIDVTTANNVTLYTTSAGTIIKGLDFAPLAPPTPTPTITPTITETPTETLTPTITATASQTAALDYTLQILHASDFEAGLGAIQDAPNFAAVVDYFDGTYANTLILSSGDNYIPGTFFNAGGDPSLNTLLGGSGAASVGRADMEILKRIGIEASAFGNHEFDAGTREVRNIIAAAAPWAGAQFPYLSSNLNFSTDSNFSGLIQSGGLEASTIKGRVAPSAIITRGGEEIGLVGITTPLLASISSPGTVGISPSNPEDMTALAAVVQPAIDAVITGGANKVIVMAHMQQISYEQALAPLLHGVDIIISGGSNTLLADAGDRLRSGDTADGTYPLALTNADGDPILIVNTEGNYLYVGRLVIGFDASGTLLPGSYITAESGAYATDNQGVQDLWGNLTDPFLPGTKGAAVKEVTDAIASVINSKDSVIYGHTNVYLNGLRAEIRTEETNLGNLTADANLAEALLSDSTVSVSIKNGGGIRDSIGSTEDVLDVNGNVIGVNRVKTVANPAAGKNAGDISQLDLENSLRFNNSLSMITVSAANLKRILEHGVAATAPGATPGQFPQIGGIAFSFDRTQTAQVLTGNPGTGIATVTTEGNRVRNVARINENGYVIEKIVENGVVLGDPDRPFRVVTLGFLIDDGDNNGLGGDNYPFPTFGSNRVNLGGEQLAFSNHLQAQYPLSGAAFNRADQPAALDTRIQNLQFRSDTIFSTTQIDLSKYVRVGRFDLPEPTRSTAPANNLLAQEASGVAYNWDTDTLFIVGDGGKSVTQVSKTGVLIDTMTLALGSSPQGTEFYDTEGITYVGGGKFVMTEERDRQAVLFTYAAGTTLTRAAAQTVDLGTFVDNTGHEGLSYDPQTSGFIFVKEISPEGIFQTDIDFDAGTATNGSPSTVNSVNLFDPALTGLSDFADVFALSNLPFLDGQPHESNLLILSQEEAKIINTDRSGTIHSTLQIVSDSGNPLSAPAQQHEGLTMDSDGNIYVVNENGGGDIDHPQLWVYAPTNVPNQAPTAVDLDNEITSIEENTSTVAPIKVADIIVTDDGLGVNDLTVTGADASFFEITLAGLYLKAGTVLDYETKTSYSVTVEVDDTTVGTTPDVTTNYILNVTDIVDETPEAPSVFISEVHPTGSSSTYVADWFEVTNAGSSTLDITGWQMDDNSNGSVKVMLRGVTSIPAGESAIFFEGAADGSTDATIIDNFLTAWFGSTTPPPGFLIGAYGGGGVGLSSSGDAVNLFDENGVRMTGVSFGSATTGVTFDNKAGLGSDTLPLPTISTLSQAGVNGAFVSADTTETGSPGRTGTIFISEVAPWSSGNSPVAADWFEVTNDRATAVDITGWKTDDNSQSFAGAAALNGITSIAPGESVIFIDTGTPSTTSATFLSTWFGANPPAGLQIGSYSGSGGLSTDGDQVNLFNSGGTRVATVIFGLSPDEPPFTTFDNAAGLNDMTISQFSVVGVNGAFAAENDTNEIGSPGTIVNPAAPTPTPTATVTATEDVTETPSPTQTTTVTPTSTASSTDMVTATPTHTVTTTPTLTKTITTTSTVTRTATRTVTKTITRTPTRTQTPSIATLTLNSIGTHDGWVLESSETSNIGGTLNTSSVAFQLGDSPAKKQYRGILSFRTGNLPDNATITSIMLKVKRIGVAGGGNPVAIFNGFMVDIKNGTFGTPSLQLTDFQMADSGTYGPFNPGLMSDIYTMNLKNGQAHINKLSTNNGLTQIRLRFRLDDNNNAIANYLRLYSGNATNAADRPQLVITYTVP